MSKIPSANENFPPSITVYDLFRIPSYKYTTNEHAKQWFCVYETKFSSDAYFDMTTITWLLLIFSLVGGFFFLSFSLVFGHISKILNIDALAKMLLHLCVPSAFFFCNNFFLFRLEILERWNRCIWLWSGRLLLFARSSQMCSYKKKCLMRFVNAAKSINYKTLVCTAHISFGARWNAPHSIHCSIECPRSCTLTSSCECSHSLTHSLTHFYIRGK